MAALVTTTLGAACTASDTQIKVASGSSFGKGKYIRIDDEFMQQSADADSASTTIIPVIRGQLGTVPKAHVITANVVMGAGADFTGSAVDTAVSYPLAGRQRRIQSYTTAGAITLPDPGTDLVVVLNSTVALAMTLAAPTTDLDGCILTVIGNGKAAHTLSLPAGIGLGAGGSGVDVGTFTSAGQVAVALMAANGAWVAYPSFFGGTSLGSITVTWA